MGSKIPFADTDEREQSVDYYRKSYKGFKLNHVYYSWAEFMLRVIFLTHYMSLFTSENLLFYEK